MGDFFVSRAFLIGVPIDDLLSVADGSASGAVTNCYQPRRFLVRRRQPGAPRLLRGSGDRSDEPRRRPGEARAPTPRALDRRWVESRTADILQIQTVAYSANTLSGTVRGKPGDVDDV